MSEKDLCSLQILQNDQLMKGNGSQDQTDGERFALNQSPTSSKKSCSCWRIGNQPIAGSSGLLSRSCHHRLTTAGAMTRESSPVVVVVGSSRLDRVTSCLPARRIFFSSIELHFLQDLDASSRVVNCRCSRCHETRTIFAL